MKIVTKKPRGGSVLPTGANSDASPACFGVPTLPGGQFHAPPPKAHACRFCRRTSRRGTDVGGYAGHLLIGVGVVCGPGLYCFLMCQGVPSLLISTLVFFSASVPAMTYTTKFPNTENPILEGSNWKNGALDGVDWTDCRTKHGLVFGTETGTNSNQYDDSTCILTGTWGPLQIVQATVFSQNQSDAYFQEVELRLHSTMSAHICTGYEVLFRVLHPGGYATIVRWDGPLGKFTYLNQKPALSYKGIQKGDVVKASIDANGLIVGYVNGVEVIRAIDTTYVGGNPGIGFWLKARGGLLRRGQGTGTNADFGFSAFTATDGRQGAVKADHHDKGRRDEYGLDATKFVQSPPDIRALAPFETLIGRSHRR